MTGKLLAIILLVSALLAGAGMYYLQVYGFYYEVTPKPGQDVALLTEGADGPAPIAYSAFRAIDADSSPIRYRACFETDLTPDQMASFVPVETPEPLTAPGWFDCYDAVALADALQSGQAQAFMGVKNIHYGVDRIVAVTQDGKGFIWHALNNCGEKAYDGTVVGEECPPRPQE
ncbi:signal transduction histidine kinase regulating citrate/malate metabolism [Rhodobacteraceae bacterium KLH11]|nr:signal transduction histidine kinase regulating citrate/malate metabolism [Rhodobacteraceae bacterium KLH11]